MRDNDPLFSDRIDPFFSGKTDSWFIYKWLTPSSVKNEPRFIEKIDSWFKERTDPWFSEKSEPSGFVKKLTPKFSQDWPI